MNARNKCQLTKSQSSITFKALLNRNLMNYSLAWVGSDEAICHLGTGLHKVPLARLQDIFLSVGRDGSGQTKTVHNYRLISVDIIAENIFKKSL